MPMPLPILPASSSSPSSLPHLTPPPPSTSCGLISSFPRYLFPNNACTLRVVDATTIVDTLTFLSLN
eukprot:837919-Pyramimonas_sp.AAC.1